MYYGLHTTSKAQRDMLMAQAGVPITVRPLDFHGTSPHKPIVMPEGTWEPVDHTATTAAFEALLDMVAAGAPMAALEASDYVRMQGAGMDTPTRVRNLPGLYADIKANGIHTPVRCEATGERLDGSYRTKIALHLGIQQVPALMHTMRWQDATKEWLIRKLVARNKSSGADYYDFDYGNGWRNVLQNNPVLVENAQDRWEVLQPLLRGTVLDLGCNEGYMAINAARYGHATIGCDTDYTHVANLNRLIYSWLDREDIPVQFIEGDIRACRASADTVLALNVLYHIPKADAVELLKRHRGKNIILQCNLRKAHVRHEYYGSHPDDAAELCTLAGLKAYATIPWRDKPILLAK